MTRYKRPDKKDALSIVNAAKKEMEFTLSLEVTDSSGPTIIKNIYECFRMLGDALLVLRGIESQDHIEPIKELLELNINTSRPTGAIGNLRILRHNISYYGYSPKREEVEDVIAIAKDCFKPLLGEVTKRINNHKNS